VVKKFPETSHAKVIEYRIRDRETLGKLFDHLLKRFQGRSSDDTFEVLN
jgi:ribosomal protein L17